MAKEKCLLVIELPNFRSFESPLLGQFLLFFKWFQKSNLKKNKVLDFTHFIQIYVCFILTYVYLDQLE